MKPTIYTVTVLDNDNEEVVPFKEAYVTREIAVQNVEQYAIERYEYMVDVNDEDVPHFPGLEWNDDFTQAYSKGDDDTVYLVTAVEVK